MSSEFRIQLIAIEHQLLGLLEDVKQMRKWQPPASVDVPKLGEVATDASNEIERQIKRIRELTRVDS